MVNKHNEYESALRRYRRRMCVSQVLIALMCLAIFLIAIVLAMSCPGLQPSSAPAASPSPSPIFVPCGPPGSCFERRQQ